MIRGFALAVGVSALCVLASAAFASGGTTSFAAGQKRGPHLFLTVANGHVTKVRWRLNETCSGSANESNSGVDVLNAPITNGTFHKSVTHTSGNPGEPNGGYTDTTSFKGTIAGNTATVKVTDNLFVASTSPCYGSRTFTATATP